MVPRNRKSLVRICGGGYFGTRNQTGGKVKLKRTRSITCSAPKYKHTSCIAVVFSCCSRDFPLAFSLALYCTAYYQ